MLLTTPFKLYNDKWDEKVQEFNIEFDIRKNKIEKLVEFAETYSTHRINIKFETIPPGLNAVLKLCPNIYIRLVDMYQYQAIVELEYAKGRFFFDFHVPNLALFGTLIELGVSDIYLADDLWYSLKDVKEYCLEHNVRIRAILNKIPTISFDKGYNLKHIIFMPQHFNLWNQYIDVAEFDCGTPYDWKKFETLYKIWFIDKDWDGGLQQINNDLKIAIPNQALLYDFIAYKIQCGLKCNKQKNTYCNKCEKNIRLGQLFYEKGAHLKIKK